MSNPRLYKILEHGRSCHGGYFEWDLPKKDGRKWIPGNWHTVDGDLRMCSKGLHLTEKPFKWYTWNCECYVAEADAIIDSDGDKHLCRKARLLRPEPHPNWWIGAHEFVEKEIRSIPWFKPDMKPMKRWRLFTGKDWDAARDAAWDAARDAAWDAAWAAARDAAWDAAGDAAWDAALYVQTHYICSGLSLLNPKHIKHAADRWRVWQKGYGLLCEIDGVLYVYGAEQGKDAA